MIAKGAFGTSIDLLLSKYLLKSIIKIMVVLCIIPEDTFRYLLSKLLCYNSICVIPMDKVRVEVSVGG